MVGPKPARRDRAGERATPMAENRSAHPDGAAAPIPPAKFAHAVLRTTRLNEMLEWYRTVLGARVVFQTPMLAFMTYDDEHHRLALAAFPGTVERPPRSAGLDHLAYTYANLGDLVSTYERLKAAGITPVANINHGMTTSMYYRDPDGNKVELQIDNFPDTESLHAFFKSADFAKNPIGVDFDPDELARRYRAGEPAAELTRYRAEKGLNRATMARLGE